MCATCGCMQPENAHGDKRNILVSDFRASALKTRVAPGSEGAALRNTRKTLAVARKSK
jgi:hypothetical protein